MNRPHCLQPEACRASTRKRTAKSAHCRQCHGKAMLTELHMQPGFSDAVTAKARKARNFMGPDDKARWSEVAKARGAKFAAQHYERLGLAPEEIPQYKRLMDRKFTMAEAVQVIINSRRTK